MSEHDQPDGQPIPFLPFEIQLIQVFPTEIIAKRLLAEIQLPLSPAVNLSLQNIHVNEQNQHAQVSYQIQVTFPTDPRPFEISFSILGLFTYEQSSPDQVRAFLTQGSLGIMLPFTRELLMDLCVRLQVPPIVLPMLRLAPPPDNQEE